MEFRKSHSLQPHLMYSLAVGRTSIGRWLSQANGDQRFTAARTKVFGNHLAPIDIAVPNYVRAKCHVGYERVDLIALGRASPPSRRKASFSRGAGSAGASPVRPSEFDTTTPIFLGGSFRVTSCYIARPPKNPPTNSCYHVVSESSTRVGQSISGSSCLVDVLASKAAIALRLTDETFCHLGANAFRSRGSMARSRQRVRSR